MSAAIQAAVREIEQNVKRESNLSPKIQRVQSNLDGVKQKLSVKQEHTT